MASVQKIRTSKILFLLAIGCPIVLALSSHFLGQETPSVGFTSYTPYVSMYTDNSGELPPLQIGFPSLVSLASILFAWGWLKRPRSVTLMSIGLAMPIIAEFLTFVPTVWQGTSGPRRYHYYYFTEESSPAIWLKQLTPSSSLEYFGHVLSLTFLFAAILVTLTNCYRAEAIPR